MEAEDETTKYGKTNLKKFLEHAMWSSLDLNDVKTKPSLTFIQIRKHTERKCVVNVYPNTCSSDSRTLVVFVLWRRVSM